MRPSSRRSFAPNSVAVTVRLSGGTNVSVIEPMDPDSVTSVQSTSGCAVIHASALASTGAAAARFVPTCVWRRTCRRL